MAENKRPKGRGDKVNKKQEARNRLFVDNYLQDFNATRAYLEEVNANVQPLSAGSLAGRLLQDTKVQEYLKQRLDERKQALHIDQSYVVRKLLEIVESDYVGTIQHVTERELEQIPANVRKLIQSIKLLKTKNLHESNGNTHETETEKYEVTFMSKDKALELLGRHTGTFAKDNVQGQYDMGRMGFTDALKTLDI